MDATEMNGRPAPQASPPAELSDNCKTVVGVLEGLLAAARRGEIVSIGAVIVGGPGQFTSTGTLVGLLELSAGADDLKDRVKFAMHAQAAEQAKLPQRASIIRPGPSFDPQHMG